MACRLAAFRPLGLTTGARIAGRISYPLLRRSLASLSLPHGSSSQPRVELSQATGEVQTTLATPVSVSGVGLHLGLHTTVTLLPATAGSGRVFHLLLPLLTHGGGEIGEEDRAVQSGGGGESGEGGRVQEGRVVEIGADVRNVVDTRLSTVLGAAVPSIGSVRQDTESRARASSQESSESQVQGVRVGTVEHLLSALEGCGVDNCVIRVERGAEMPLLDGSAAEWVQHIVAAGVQPATAAAANAAAGTGATVERRRWNLPGNRPITVQHGDSFIAAFPRAAPLLTYGIDFPHVPAIGRQWVSWEPLRPQWAEQAGMGGEEGEAGEAGEAREQAQECGDYVTGIAPARTFCILEQVEQMRAAGLIKGGSLDNALVCSQTRGWVNPPLRVPLEPCRHKLLDLIGDLALCGRGGNSGIPNAHIVAYKASHALHVAFGRALMDAIEVELEQAVGAKAL